MDTQVHERKTFYYRYNYKIYKRNLQYPASSRFCGKKHTTHAITQLLQIGRLVWSIMDLRYSSTITHPGLHLVITTAMLLFTILHTMLTYWQAITRHQVQNISTHRMHTQLMGN